MWRQFKFTVWQILISLDQLANVLTGGWSDETFSSRVYRKACDGHAWAIKAKKILDTLFFWDQSHCYSAYLSELERLQQPPEFRE